MTPSSIIARHLIPILRRPKENNLIITLYNQAISAEQLLEFLADLLLETRPDALNTGPDFHYNVNDAIDILPKLQTGLDVNVREVAYYVHIVLCLM